MAFGAGSFAQGLMGGLQTGLSLADRRKESKREKIASEVAKEKVAADGVKTFDAAELQGQEHLIAGVAEGMTPQQKAEYVSMRRVPLGVEKSQELQVPAVDMGAIPAPNMNAGTEAQKFNRPQAALPVATPPIPTPVGMSQQAPAPQGYYLKDGKTEYAGPGAVSAENEIETPKYQAYKDTFGRERYTTQLRDRTPEEVAFDTATRLQQMGDTKGADEYMARYDTALERGSKIRAKNLMESSQLLQAGIMFKDQDKVAKGVSGIMGTLQKNPDGMTWGLNRSPDGNELVLTATDTGTGMPAPPQIKGYPAGTMAVFKADPTAGMSAEEVMALQMTALAKGDLAGFTKQIAEARKAIADIHQSEAGTNLSNVRAELAPKELSLEERYKMGILGVQQFEAQTGRMNAASNRIRALSGEGGAAGFKGNVSEDDFKYDNPETGNKTTITRYRVQPKNSTEFGYAFPGVLSASGGQGVLNASYGKNAVAVQNVLTRASTLGWSVLAGNDGRLYFSPKAGVAPTLITEKALEKYGNGGRLYNAQ
jgi:hypothetical protein